MNRFRTFSLAILALLLTGAGVDAQQATPVATVPPPAATSERPARLAGVKSWAYQLQKADVGEIAASPFDLVVIDLTKNGNAEKPLKPAELARMKKKPGGGRRIVLAYVSVGEAEDYRFYWDDEWTETPTPEHLAEAAAKERAAAGLPPIDPATATAPPVAAPSDKPAKPVRWLTEKAPTWLGDENETWSGNFAVKFWDKGWQDLIFGAPNSYLDRIVAAGFDGIYLDRVDAHYEYMHERAADEEMADFVIRLAAAARAKTPDFIVVPQNGEELLLKPAYVAAIDGIAKEDLFFGHPTEGERNFSQQVRNSLGWLKPATDAGHKVLVIEYLQDEPALSEAKSLITEQSFVPYFGPRALDRLIYQDRLMKQAAQRLKSQTSTAGGLATTPAAAAPAPSPAPPAKPPKRSSKQSKR